ncbi:hypothetical protein V8G54_008116 [Vigna mungo]|uniref:Uncharacterized protein n=1 Tax=Vigna mungo TaxID=3915 RepID=A0AAQ3S9P6_VIGMU
MDGPPPFQSLPTPFQIFFNYKLYFLLNHLLSFFFFYFFSLSLFLSYPFSLYHSPYLTPPAFRFSFSFVYVFSSTILHIHFHFILSFFFILVPTCVLMMRWSKNDYYSEKSKEQRPQI